MRKALARRLGVDEDTAFDFIEALPYSCIPEAYDALVVLDWLEDHGWTRSKEINE